METNLSIQKLDDISLMELLCTTNRETAYTEFVNRFYEDVLNECNNKCKLRKIDSHVGEEIAHKTFERVRKYKSFDRSKLKAKDPRKAIMGWLYKTLNNLFYDYHNSKKEEIEPSNFYFDQFTEQIDQIDPEKLADKKEITMTIFSKLTEKQREVILTDIEYKRGRKYLPPEILESLATRMGVKKNSIRKIRERAMLKIKKALDEINN